MSAPAPTPAIRVAGGGLARVTTRVVVQSGEPLVERGGRVARLDPAKNMAQVAFDDGGEEWIEGRGLRRQNPMPQGPANAPAPAPPPPPPVSTDPPPRGGTPAIKVGNGLARVGTLVEVRRSLATGPQADEARKGHVTKLDPWTASGVAQVRCVDPPQDSALGPSGRGCVVP